MTKTGHKYWHMKFFVGKKKEKEQVLALGTYPKVTLADAREKASIAQKLVDQGIDPRTKKQEIRAGNAGGDTFEAVGLKWHEVKKGLVKPKTAQTILSRFKRYVFPAVGALPITEVTSGDLFNNLTWLHTEKQCSVDVIRRLEIHEREIFAYAIVKNLVTVNVAAAMKGSPLPKREESHYAAITDPEGLSRLLVDIDDYQGDFLTQRILRLAPLLFVRPGNLLEAEWPEVDFISNDKPQWTVPAGKLKPIKGVPRTDDLIVPLSRQAVEIFTELWEVTGQVEDNGNKKEEKPNYVFPSTSTKKEGLPMAEGTVNEALRSMGYDRKKHVFHGFRATARTLLEEELDMKEKWIEMQLGHIVKGQNGKAYNRTKFLEARRAMMQAWSDYLDGLKTKYRAAHKKEELAQSPDTEE